VLCGIERPVLRPFDRAFGHSKDGTSGHCGHCFSGKKMAPGSERVPGGDGGLRATFPGAKVQMQTERSSVSSICETVARVDHEEVAYPLPTP
jgi:hypothetical protein